MKRVKIMAPHTAGLLLLAAGLPGTGLAQEPRATLTLPESTAEQPPAIRAHLVLRQDAILVDGVQLVNLGVAQDGHGDTIVVVPDDQKRGMMITPLYDRLNEKFDDDRLMNEAYEILAVLTQRADVVHEGELLLSIDEDVPFSVVREVLYTAGQARWSTFLFVTHNPWEDAACTVESTLPSIGPPRPGDDDEPATLRLSIAVTAQGLDLMGVDAEIAPDGALDTAADRSVPTVPCVSGGVCTGIDDYDWGELNRLLGLIKDEHPDDLRVIVVPEAQIPFDVVVRTLDHARWAPYLPLDAEQGAWESWKSVRRELFPLSILAGGAS